MWLAITAGILLSLSPFWLYNVKLLPEKTGDLILVTWILSPYIIIAFLRFFNKSKAILHSSILIVIIDFSLRLAVYLSAETEGWRLLFLPLLFLPLFVFIFGLFYFVFKIR
jgi:hypothetical protein